MRRAIIGYNNRIDSATLSGGSWQAPLTNIQTRYLQEKARSTDASLSSTVIDVNLGEYRVINIVGITAHNFSVDAIYRLTAGETAGASDVYDSGWLEAWPAVYGTSELEWEDDNFWDGKLTQEEREGYNACIAVETAIVGAQYWRIEINDTGNPDGFVEIGRLFFGRVFEPEKGFEVGAEISWDDKSEINQTLQAVDIYNRIQKFRRATLIAPILTREQAYQQAFEMQRLSGTTEEVLLIGEAGNPAETPRQSFIGRFDRLNPIRASHYDICSTGFEIKELI